MAVELLGYSERGMMNSLCYDMLSGRDVRRVEEFLSWFDFSQSAERPCFVDVECARLIVEQSFSDFGDLDLLILLDHKAPFGPGRPPAKQAVLIEAKVSTDTNHWLTIGGRFDDFLRLVDGGEGSTSNLFVQLHRKVRLVERIGGERDGFDPDLFTPRGSLGTNHAVSRAAKALNDYITGGGLAWYAAIVPDDPVAVAAFVQDVLPVEGVNLRLPRWDTSRWGFLSWHTVGARVDAQEGQWPITRATLEWNSGQIFRNQPPVGHVVQQGQVYCADGKPVFVVYSGAGVQRRVAELQGHDPKYFWRTRPVPEFALHACPDPAPAIEPPTLPILGSTYRWADRKDGLRPTREPHPAGMIDGTPLKVLGPSWFTTRVRLDSDPSDSRGFLVYTHYLKRGPVV